MVCVSTPEVYVVRVFAISVHVLNGDTELCHFTTVPVCPESVSRPLLLPGQMVEPPVTVPPMLKGSTLTLALDE